jgi:glycosyltransferase involved in cell wall biosynthesis
MNVLALDPYFGGSHKAFLDGFSSHSRHEWTVLSLPAHNWKWRMRHAPVTFAEQLADADAEADARRRRWDVLFCSDMLDLAAFRGLAPAPVRDLPAVAYFHENQLTYPVRHDEPRDAHFALTNMTTALAAEAVWFNSAYHRDAFLDAVEQLLRQMPDHRLPSAVDRIRARSSVHPPGIDPPPARPQPRPPGPLRILWAARWEHDKGFDTFRQALRLLTEAGVDFRVSVIGQSFRDVPEAFARARQELGDRVDRWGYQPTRDQYQAALAEADVFVSTAEHEFFGISAVEAIAAGAFPILPDRLAHEMDDALERLVAGKGESTR